MTQYTPKALLPYAELTDAANMLTFGSALTAVLDNIISPKYALLTDRNAANPSPAGGDCCYVGETDKYYIYSTSVGAWIYNTPWVKYKTASTGRSSTTKVDDPHLTFTVEAGSVYRFQMALAFGESATALGWQNSLTIPASSTVQMMGSSIDTTSASFNNAGTNYASTMGFAASPVTASGGDGYQSASPGVSSWQSGVLLSGNGGTFAMNWGQHNSSAGTTTLMSGSWMEIFKIG